MLPEEHASGTMAVVPNARSPFRHRLVAMSSRPTLPSVLQEPHAAPTVRELALSAAWHGGFFSTLHTSAGEELRVVHRGSWSHGFGPDFNAAMLEVAGRSVMSGDIEIHLRASDWQRHGHHLDPRYNSVVLHVVTLLDTAETRREDGQLVPVAVVNPGDEVLFAIDQELPAVWHRLGQSVCAANLARDEPQRLRAAFHQLGDQRFSDRVTRFAGELEMDTLSTVLLRGIFDAFGYTMNRAPLNAMFSILRETGLLAHWHLDPKAFGHTRAKALMFGLGGFLPLSPGDAHLAGLAPADISPIETAWQQEFAATLDRFRLPATDWSRARTRPANHPAARLSTLATLLATCGGDPTPLLMDALRRGDDPRQVLRVLAQRGSGPELGMPRATAVVGSVVLPVFMAWAQQQEDNELEDTIARRWAELPRSEWSRPATRALAQAAGDGMRGPFGERAVQGLLHLDRTLCTPRRCFECPVAAEVVASARRSKRDGEQKVQSMPSMLPT